jgi:hypothetical protein
VTQISILKGIYTDEKVNFLASYPVNMDPIIGENGISKGYLRTSAGIVTVASGLGADRGAMVWDNFLFRVMGTKLYSIVANTPVELGTVGGAGPVSMDYSFDRLAIASAGVLYYWNGVTLDPVTDPDIGTVLDVVYIDGYYMTTDGENLVVTELNDPFAVNPIKYGSSEAQPDPVVGLMVVRDEVYAVNTNTIENFQNVGGTGFPFQANPAGLIPKGAVGTHAMAYFLDTFAFVGSGRGEALSVYIAGEGSTTNISTPTIDAMIAADGAQTQIEVEAIQERGEQKLLIHLQDRTLVYYHQATRAAETPVWTILRGGVQADQPYPGRHFVYSSSAWYCGSQAGEIGYLDDVVKTQFGDETGCQFDTAFLFNEGRGAILKVVELVGLPGRTATTSSPTAMLSWTVDGQTYSQERAVSIGNQGQRNKRMQWRPKVRFPNYLGMRFRLPSSAIVSFARLDVEAEPLNV